MNIRFFITILGCLMWGGMSSGANPDLKKIWANPQPILERIMTLIPTGDYHSQEKGALAPELQSLAYAISQAIMAADSPTMLSPTPERKEVIRRWGEILSPYTGKLVSLALDVELYRTHAGRQSRSVLDYAPATARLINPGARTVPDRSY